MRAICRPVGAIVALAITASAGAASAQDTKLTVPNVTVTAPPVPVQPPYLRDPGKSYERNPYAGRYRVEEDKCLQGYRLVPGPSFLSKEAASNATWRSTW
jgi:hypothetical protein